MRIDRLLALAFFKPLQFIFKPKNPNATAILMYHAVSNNLQHGMHPYFKTVISPERFKAHLNILVEGHFEVIPLSQIFSKPSPAASQKQRVVITFDDGFADFSSSALPLLAARNFSATVFLPTAFISTGKTLEPGCAHMTWQDAQTTLDQGSFIGTHTVNHFKMRTLSSAQIHHEIAQSQAEIQKHIGYTVSEFACPFAFPLADTLRVRAIQTALASCGYTRGVTTSIGRATHTDDPYTLKRLPINEDDDDQLFRAKLLGAYDWLGTLQSAFKTTLALVRALKSPAGHR